MRTSLAALAVCLVAALPAAAQDKCLTGASTLPDQRDLAALRTSTDAACPCATFTSRADYQKCARGALDAALAGGDLRSECKRTATKINKGAVCGSTRIACGRYAPTKKTPLSCKVKDAPKCQDGHGFQSTACTAETHCADVVDWTASTCVDVRDFGPYAPGVRVMTFTKTSVTTYCTGGTGSCGTPPRGAGCACGSAADCTSGVCEQQTRTLTTPVWYPAPPGSGPIDPMYAGVLNAPLDGTAAPYPILMFSHGSCGFPLQSKFLTPLVATYGFVVAAPPHPGNTIADPGCGSPSSQAASFLERATDIRFVLDQMLAANGDSMSPFFGSIDPNRIGMSGHSFGGNTTYNVVSIDSRFKTALPMAGAVVGMPMLTVPSMSMLGQIDSVVNLPAIRTTYDNAQPPKYLVEIKNAGHFAFSDGCFPGPDCNPPTTLTQPEAHADVLRYAVPFLMVYLAGDQSFLPFLSLPAGPSFEVRAEP